MMPLAAADSVGGLSVATKLPVAEYFLGAGVNPEQIAIGTPNLKQRKKSWRK